MSASAGVVADMVNRCERAKAPPTPAATPTRAVISGSPAARSEPRVSTRTRAAMMRPKPSVAPTGGSSFSSDSLGRALMPAFSAAEPAASTTPSVAPSGRSCTCSFSWNWKRATSPPEERSMPGTGCPPTTSGRGWSPPAAAWAAASWAAFCAASCCAFSACAASGPACSACLAAAAACSAGSTTRSLP